MGRPRGKAHLTRAVLASELSDLLNLPRGKHGRCRQGGKIVDAILHVIIEALRRGEEVKIQGLGRFYIGLTKPTHFPRTVERKFNGVRAKTSTPRRPTVKFVPSYSIRRDPT